MDRPDTSPDQRETHTDLFDKIRAEAFGCQDKSPSPRPIPTDRLEYENRKTNMGYLNLPLDASEQSVCQAEGLLHVERARKTVSSLEKAVKTGDLGELDHAVRGINTLNIYEPVVNDTGRKAVDGIFKQAGISQNFDSLDRRIDTLYKDHGDSADIIDFSHMNPSAIHLEKDGQGRIKSAISESPDEAFKAMLGFEDHRNKK